jgi:hypothetical protein
MNEPERDRVTDVLARLDSQAERAGTAPAGLAWTDAANMVRAALTEDTDIPEAK